MGNAKLERALRSGGMAERVENRGYRVWRCRNRQRRSVGMLSLKAGDSLRADGKIRLKPGEVSLYIWGSAGPEFQGAPATPVLKDMRGRKSPRTFLQRAIDCAKDAEDQMRLADAACWLSDDFTLANNPQRVTMNWGQLVQGKVDGTPSVRARPRSYRSGAATERLTIISETLGHDAWDLLHWTFISELSGREVARRLNTSAPQAALKLASALREVADIYYNKVRRRD